MAATQLRQEPEPGEERIAAQLLWAPAAATSLGIVAVAMGITGGYTLDWGDGARTEGAIGGVPNTHVYLDAGSYRVTALLDGAPVARAVVYVRRGTAPRVEFTADTDNPQVISATVLDDPEEIASLYSITWSPEETPAAERLPWGSKRAFGFEPGSHDVHVQDHDTGRAGTTRLEVAALQRDPAATVARGAGELVLDLTITALGEAKDLLVDWGDWTREIVTAPAVGRVISHTYARPWLGVLQVMYADGSGTPEAILAEVPVPVPPGDTAADDDADDPRHDSPEIWWSPDPLRRHTVVLGLLYSGSVPRDAFYRLEWGDGKVSTIVGEQTVSHTYLLAGAHPVMVYDRNGRLHDRTMIYALGDLEPEVTLTASAENPGLIELRFPDAPDAIDADGVFTARVIDWHDDSGFQALVPTKDLVVTHTYPPGEHQVLVVDRGTQRWTRKTVTVVGPVFDPDFTLTRPETGTELTVQLTLTAVGAAGKNVLVDWGDRRQDLIEAAAVGQSVTHVYDAGETYIVQGAYSDGSAPGTAKVITLPWSGGRADAASDGEVTTGTR